MMGEVDVHHILIKNILCTNIVENYEIMDGGRLRMVYEFFDYIYETLFGRGTEYIECANCPNLIPVKLGQDHLCSKCREENNTYY